MVNSKRNFNIYYRVNVPIKLTKNLHWVIFSAQDIGFSTRSYDKIQYKSLTKIFNFILNDKSISIKMYIIKCKKSGCA